MLRTPTSRRGSRRPRSTDQVSRPGERGGAIRNRQRRWPLHHRRPTRQRHSRSGPVEDPTQHLRVARISRERQRPETSEGDQRAPTRAQKAPGSMRYQGLCWWRRWESNPRPSACKADALPIELRPRIASCISGRGDDIGQSERSSPSRTPATNTVTSHRRHTRNGPNTMRRGGTSIGTRSESSRRPW